MVRAWGASAAAQPNHRLQLMACVGLGCRCGLGLRSAAVEAFTCGMVGQCPQLKRGSLGGRRPPPAARLHRSRPGRLTDAHRR